MKTGTAIPPDLIEKEKKMDNLKPRLNKEELVTGAQGYALGKRTNIVVVLTCVLFAASLSFASAGFAASPSCASMVTVVNNQDSGAGSLRQAIVDVCDAGTINFNIPLPSTITLTSGELVVDKGMRTNGPGANKLSISANNTSRILNVSGSTVRVSDLSIINGRLSNDFNLAGGGIY